MDGPTRASPRTTLLHRKTGQRLRQTLKILYVSFKSLGAMVEISAATNGHDLLLMDEQADAVFLIPTTVEIQTHISVAFLFLSKKTDFKEFDLLHDSIGRLQMVFSYDIVKRP